MSRLRTALVFAGAFLAATSAVASADVPAGTSVHIGITTNALFRGVSQTSDSDFYHMGGKTGMATSTTTADDDVFATALYGGVDYQHASGFYAGAAATTVDIPGADAVLRVDGFGGYRQQLQSGLRWDAGAIVYTFPGEGDFNFWEVYAGLGYGPVGGKVWYDPVNHDTYYQATFDFDVGSGLDLSLYAGHYALDTGPDYTDFGVRISKAFGGLRVGAGLADTDIDNAIPYLYVTYRLPH
jgi:uncharacterized protein (TIGR02001 family)